MMICFLATALFGQVDAPRLPNKIDERVRASVVSLQNHTKAGLANGVVVDRAGPVIYVLTASHFFDSTDQLSATFFTPGPALPKTEVVTRVRVEKRNDPNTLDLAVLRL